MPERVFQDIHAAISEAMRRFILKKSGQFTAEEGLDLFLTREDRQAIAHVRELGGDFHEDLLTRFVVEAEAGARIEFALGWNRWAYRILPCGAHASPIIADILRDPNRHHNRELAARVVGIPVLRTKLLAFGLSSFIIGVAGVLWAFAYLRTVEPAGFNLDRSFQILFVIIIGGLANPAWKLEFEG